MGLFQFVYEKSMTYKWIKRLATSTLRLLDHLHDYAVLIALTKLNVRFATLGMAAWGSIPILVQNVKFETLTWAPRCNMTTTKRVTRTTCIKQTRRPCPHLPSSGQELTPASPESKFATYEVNHEVNLRDNFGS